MAKQADRREKTRATLLREARRLFLAHGYEATTTQMILDAAGLSKGALYHHFKSKDEIMEALYRQASEAAIKRAQTGSERGAYLDRLRKSALAWLREIKKPSTAKILLELGPQALGWRKAKAIEDENSLRVLTHALESACKANETHIGSPAAAARLLNALLAEAALLSLHNKGAQQDDIELMIVKFVDGLKAGGRG